MSNTPLRLESYFFDQVRISANPDFDESMDEDVSEDLVVSGQILAHKDDKNKYQSILKVELESKTKRAPYEFLISVRGFFTIEDQNVDERRKSILLENGTFSILYGAVREYLLMLTSRGPWSGYILPSFRFPLPTEKAKLQKKAERPQKPPQAAAKSRKKTKSKA